MCLNSKHRYYSINNKNHTLVNVAVINIDIPTTQIQITNTKLIFGCFITRAANKVVASL